MIVLSFIPILLISRLMTTVKGDCNQKLGDDLLPKKKDFPAFTAYRELSLTVPAYDVVKFDKVWTNNGNGYDPSSGVFTASFAGLYHFAAVVMSVYDATLYLSLFQNNTKIATCYLTNKEHKTGTFDVVLSLKKGDKVSIRTCGRSQTIFGNWEKYSNFSGNLIVML